MQTWLAALLVPDPEGLIANGDAGGTAFYDAAGVAGGAWLAKLTAIATAIAWGFANSLVAQAATSRLLFAMARDRQLPGFLAKVHPTRRVPVNATFLVAVVSLALGLYMCEIRDDGITLLSTLVNFGAMTAFLVLHVSVVWHFVVRNGSRNWWKHLAVPVIGFGILLFVIINANVAAQTARLRLAGDRRPAAGVPGRHRAQAGDPRGGRPVTTSLEVVSVEPAPEQLRYSFGAGEPLLTVRPGTVVELTTEDCFGGRVRGVDDLPSQVCQFPYLNPVTGPIAVEGAEPGDTLAVHLVEIAPARDWAVSSTFPHFGALTTTHSTAMLHAGARRAGVGLRDRPGARHLPIPAAPRRPRRWSCRSTRCTGRSASRRPAARSSPASRPARTAGTWTPRRCAPG